MSASDLPRGIRHSLRALERRLFRVLFSFGLGRAAWKGCALLLAVFLLDRFLDPPTAARVALTLLALGTWVCHLRTDLLLPMRRRPRPRDLAAWWERSDPQLGDLLATAVDLAEPETPGGRGSVDFQRETERLAELIAGRLRATEVVPGGRARRSLLAGCAAIAALVTLGVLRAEDAGIFARRMLGQDLPWPSDTTLVLQPLFVDGAEEAVPLIARGLDAWSAALARGSVATIRVRAEGKLPDRVLARGLEGGPRPMVPAGSGEFLLRLPPLEEDLELHFRGGDDDDDKPELRLIAGDAPAISEWLVRATPPAYTGLPSEEDGRHEWRVPRGTQFELQFRTDRLVQEPRGELLNGSPMAISTLADGWFKLEFTAVQSDQVSISLVGQDGFLRRRAGVLRWEAEPDRVPQVRVLFPDARWTTVPGASIPLAVTVTDDYGVTELRLRDFSGAEATLPLADPRQFRQVLRLLASASGSAEGLAEARAQAEVTAQDGAAPLPQAARAQSPWVEIDIPEVFEQRQADRLVRVRVQTAALRDRLVSTLAMGQELEASFVRRARRDLESLVSEVETELLMRLWSGLDAGTLPHAAAIEPELLNARPEPGSRLDALHAAGLARPLDRSGLLADLAEAFLMARRGPARALEEAAAARANTHAPATALIADLDRVLEILTIWEDYQSALNLLRDLIQRQREILLRTQEVSGR